MSDGTSPGPCLEERTIVAFFDARLSDSERASAQAHVDTCPDCLELFALLARLQAKPKQAAPQRYEIRREIGAGGMGQVFQAFDSVLNREVALKCVHEGRGAEAATQRFEREMGLTARLQHPSIIPIYDAGFFDDGSRYFAMRLVEGRTLEDALAGATTSSERLALIPSIRRACEAVAYAHQQSVVHRDLKPANVLIGPFGETVVLDWGLAKDLRSAEASTHATEPPDDGPEDATRQGAVMGTPGYISPEVERGQPAGAPADVFALGRILAKTLPERAQVETHRATADAFADLRAIVERATAADPERRYPHAGALCDELRRFEAGQTVEARDYSPGTLVRRFVRRHRLPVALVVSFLMIGGLTGSWGLFRIISESARAEAARAEAEERRAQERERRLAAQKLIGFIVSDLQDSLLRIGRNDLLEATANESLEYFAALETGDANDALQEAEVLMSIGNAFVDFGDGDRAREAYEAAAERARRAAATDPERSRLVALSAQARAASQHSDPSVKRTELLAVIDEAERGIRESDTPVEWFKILGPPLGNLYRVELALGHPEEAVRALDRLEAWLDEPLGPEGPWKEIADKDRLGLLKYRAQDAERRGDLDAQIEHSEQLVELARAQIAAHPDDQSASGIFIVALTELGFGYRRRGDLEATSRAFAEAADLAERNVAASPHNNTHLRFLGRIVVLLGRSYKSRRLWDEAARVLTRSEDVATQLLRAAPDNPYLLRELLARSSVSLCAVEHERGQHDAALSACDRGKHALERASSLDPSSRHELVDDAMLEAYTAQAAQGAGEVDRARRHAARARTLLDQARGTRPRNIVEELEAGIDAALDGLPP